MELNLSVQQKQQLSQAQIQSIEILAMDVTELNQFLKNEYLENPLLDHTEKNTSTVNEPITAYYEQIGTYRFDSYASTDEEDNRTKDFSAPKENLLRDYLLAQLDIRLYSRQEWNLFIYLIACLDDNGFFTMPVEEVAEKTGAPEELIQRSIKTLKNLEPYGIFSANLKECLLCQLDALDSNTEILTHLIQFHLEDIADGKISNISRGLHISTVEVRKNIEIISQLNPRPLAGFGSERNSYMIPDVIFQKESGVWSVILNDSWIENYHLNDYYIKMMNQSTDEYLTEYFKSKLARIHFIMQSIEQRRQTILSISNILLEKQRAFFEGLAPLSPMTMSDMAGLTGKNVSTISRAVKGKYLQYPTGNIFIKNLFTAPVSNHKNGNISPHLVKDYIKQYIEAENKYKPYSDSDLVTLLNKENIRVSRRTVAKYREELGIKGSFERRQF